MHGRSLLFAAAAGVALTACTSTGARQDVGPASTFTSDRISVVTRGRGPDIILVHGLAGHRDVWNVVADSLDDRYRLHLVQINGFGGAAPGANADGPIVAPVSEEIARYIRATRLRAPALVGHSMGGTIGMTMAARHPRLVGRLMVVDAPPFLGAAFGPPGATAEGIRSMADQMRDAILATPPGGTGPLEQMVQTMTRAETARAELQRYARASHRRTVANAIHEGIVTDLRPELGRITAPITALYVVPANVPVAPDEFERAMRLLFSNAPDARLIRIEDSNHYIQIDQPARFVAEVDAFMRR